MIVVQKTTERHYQRDPGQDSWLSLGQSEAPALSPFGSLAVFRERKLVPGAAIRESREEGEIITYVRSGSLAFQDSVGLTGVLRGGEFQLMTGRVGLASREMNVSPIHEAHVFQIWLRPVVLDEWTREIKYSPVPSRRRFTPTERNGRLCAVASFAGPRRDLKLRRDAVLYSALFEPGQTVMFALARGRGAWLHVVSGRLKAGSVDLESGDGAGFSEEAGIKFVVLEPTEILLLDLGHFSPEPKARRPSNDGAS